MMDPTKIFLIGFMGSGKTKLGKKLASAMDYHFFDLDDVIEKEQGKSINEIFEEIGEEGFRKLENNFLTHFKFPSKSVISCGGGTPCFHNNMEIINQLGLSIYLNTPKKTLLQRLEKGKYKRPLIKDLTEEELLLFIQSRMKTRAVFYERAQITLNSIDNDLDEVMQLILNYSSN